MLDMVSVLGGCKTSFKSYILWDSHEKFYKRLVCIVFITACFDNKMTVSVHLLSLKETDLQIFLLDHLLFNLPVYNCSCN